MAIPVLKQTTEFRIEKGVPLPSVRAKYPLGEMDVGDSFHIDAAERARLVSAASFFGTRKGKKFSVRKEVNGSGYRCWRTA